MTVRTWSAAMAVATTAVLLVVPVGGAAAAPVADNPSFDSSTASWTPSIPGSLVRTTSSGEYDSAPAAGKWYPIGGGQTLEETFTGTFLTGRTYVLSFRARVDSDPLDEGSILTSFGALGTDQITDTALGSDTGGEFETRQVMWTPEADRTGVRFRMTYQTGGPLAEIFIDTLSLQEITPARYQVKFQDSFEGPTFPQVFATGAWNASPLIDGSGSFTRRIPSGYSATDGAHVAESRVNAGGTRSEIQCHRAGTPYTCVGGEGSEWYYEWDLRIPSGQVIKDAGPPQAAGPGVNQTKSWTPPGEEDCYTGGLVATQAADPSEFRLVLRIRGGAPTQGGGACEVPTDAFRDLGTFSRDDWHHILLHAKWSDDPSVGFMEVEIDGVKEPGHGLPKEHVQNFLGEGRLQMFRIGIYSVPGPDAPMTFQYDNVVIGTP